MSEGREASNPESPPTRTRLAKTITIVKWTRIALEEVGDDHRPEAADHAVGQDHGSRPQDGRAQGPAAGRTHEQGQAVELAGPMKNWKTKEGQGVAHVHEDGDEAALIGDPRLPGERPGGEAAHERREARGQPVMRLLPLK